MPKRTIVLSGAFEAFDFLATDLLEGFVEFLHDMETIQNVKSLRRLFANHIEIGFPHIPTMSGAPSYQASFVVEAVLPAEKRGY